MIEIYYQIRLLERAVPSSANLEKLKRLNRSLVWHVRPQAKSGTPFEEVKDELEYYFKFGKRRKEGSQVELPVVSEIVNQIKENNKRRKKQKLTRMTIRELIYGENK